MRGTAADWRPYHKPCRITPACAGNSPAARASPRVFRDHPRVCGEQALSPSPANRRLGSPPRVRGTAICHYFLQPPYRITPACAGNRSGLYWIDAILEDHPRVCGEQALVLSGCDSGDGSPPRVRGTVIHGGLGNVNDGITPACAGNSLRHQSRIWAGSDHPRVCGEQPTPTVRFIKF